MTSFDTEIPSSTKLIIFPDPKPKNVWDYEGNPHPQFLFRGLKNSLPDNVIAGISSSELLSRNFWKSLEVTDVVLIHWPDSLLNWPFKNRLGIFTDRFLWFIFGAFYFQIKKIKFKNLKRSISLSNGKIILIFHDLQGHDLKSFKKKLDFQVRKYLLEESDALVVLELSTLPVIENHYQVKPNRVFCSPIGDLSEFHGLIVEKTEARKHLSISTKAKVVVLAGNYRKARNLRYIQKISEKIDIHFLVFGSGIPKSIKSKPNFQVLGFVSKSEVSVLMSASDYLVHFGDHYLNSAAVRLAISYRIPVVAPNYGATVDLARHCLIELKDSKAKTLLRTLANLPSTNTTEYHLMQEMAAVRNSERSWNASIDGLLLAIRSVQSI